ncbi:YoaK family small membrane protein [Erwiniaceae bacterium L1_54_6]|nr:YoaK family small membrane protein [Erwiniaceae bacterium L1_54_6]
MKIRYLFPVAVIITGVVLLVWFIASGAYAPGR